IFTKLPSPKKQFCPPPEGFSSKRNLYPYQQSSLVCMYRKETFPETRDDPLWEKQDGVYIRVLDRTETRLKIPQVTDARGGLLCEDMGTGKTAIVIALILKTKGTWANQPEGSEICNMFEKKSLQDLCKEWI